jgi:outer membrane lipoprotein-sorting protein
MRLNYKLFNIVLLISIIELSVFAIGKLDVLSLEMESKTLRNGKAITVKSNIYYRLLGSKLVTHTTFPFESISMTDAQGEMTYYEFKSNKVSMNRGEDYSSKGSFIYNFLNGKINDMGLPEMNMKLKNTSMDGKIVISNWVTANGNKKGLQKIVVAHENGLPIFMNFINEKNEAMQKVYYNKYADVGLIKLPTLITEIVFENGNKDSVITRRNYRNIKTNNEVDLKYLDFKVPQNAQIVKKQ